VGGDLHLPHAGGDGGGDEQREAEGGGPDEQVAADPAEVAARRSFVEEFGTLWTSMGAPPIEGRVLAYLMITPEPDATTAELIRELNASAGAVSMATRHLVEVGFIQRHVVPGERVHRFRVDDDVWGSWLAREHTYLDRLRAVLERSLSRLGPDAERPRRRLTNGRAYHEWLAGYHRKMLDDWQAYKREHGMDEEGPR